MRAALVDPATSRFLATLLAEWRWVQRLAEHLVRDPALADDVSQEAYLAAMRNPPDPKRPVKGWLATIVRNLVRQSARAERRRRLRETAAARPEAQSVEADVVERLFLQHRVSAAVAALAEPYRSTILLRHFDGLGPKAIAQRLSVPVATVKTRLARGHELLRERLGGDASGERRPTIALLPLLFVPSRASLFTGILLMKMKVAALLFLVAGLAAWWYFDESTSISTTGVSAGGPASPAPQGTAESPEGLDAAPIKTTSFRPPAEAAPAPDPGATTDPKIEIAARKPGSAPRLSGRVLDDRGAAVARLVVRFEPIAPSPTASRPDRPGVPPSVASDWTGVTDAQGCFALAVPASSGLVVSADPARATVIAGSFNPLFPDAETVVVVAQARKVSGRIVDEGGRPLEGAEVVVRAPLAFRSRIDAVFDHSADQERRTRASDGGSFALDAVPAVEGAVLAARLDPYVITELPLASLPESDAVVVLRRPEPRPGCLQGQVIDAEGRIAAGAWVAMNRAGAVSDERGIFVLDLSAAHAVGPVRAVKMGFLPGELAPPRGKETRPEDWPPFIILKLGPPALEISGRVVDAAQRPVAGVQVFAADPTLFGRVGQATAVLENLMRGAKNLVFDPSLTDEEGRFLIQGLMPRDYPIRVLDPSTLLMVEAGPFKAGRRDVTIVVPAGAYWDRLAGRVVGDDGRAVAGVRVKPMIDALRVSVDGRPVMTSHADLEGMTTDGEGRFEFRKVPRERVYVRVDGDAIFPVEYGRSAPGGLAELCKGRLEDIDVPVKRRCHLKVDLAGDLEAADEVGFFDDSGRAVMVNVFSAHRRSTTERVALTSGRSDTLALPATATTLVLYRGGQEVRRAQIQLIAGEVTIVRP